MPPLLRARHLSTWAWPYALAASSGILTAVALAPDAQARIGSVRKVATVVTAAVLPVVGICIYLLTRHSTPAGIANGVFVRPFALADVYVNPFRLQPRSVAIAVAVAALALSAARRDSAGVAWLPA